MSYGGSRIDVIAVVKVVIVIKARPKIQTLVGKTRTVGKNILAISVRVGAAAANNTTPSTVKYERSLRVTGKPYFDSCLQMCQGISHFGAIWKRTLSAVNGRLQTSTNHRLRADLQDFFGNKQNSCQFPKSLTAEVCIPGT